MNRKTVFIRKIQLNDAQKLNECVKKIRESNDQAMSKFMKRPLLEYGFNFSNAKESLKKQIQYDANKGSTYHIWTFDENNNKIIIGQTGRQNYNHIYQWITPSFRRKSLSSCATLKAIEKWFTEDGFYKFYSVIDKDNKSNNIATLKLGFELDNNAYSDEKWIDDYNNTWKDIYGDLSRKQCNVYVLTKSKWESLYKKNKKRNKEINEFIIDGTKNDNNNDDNTDFLSIKYFKEKYKYVNKNILSNLEKQLFLEHFYENDQNDDLNNNIDNYLLSGNNNDNQLDMFRNADNIRVANSKIYKNFPNYLEKETELFSFKNHETKSFDLGLAAFIVENLDDSSLENIRMKDRIIEYVDFCIKKDIPFINNNISFKMDNILIEEYNEKIDNKEVKFLIKKIINSNKKGNYNLNSLFNLKKDSKYAYLRNLLHKGLRQKWVYEDKDKYFNRNNTSKFHEYMKDLQSVHKFRNQIKDLIIKGLKNEAIVPIEVLMAIITNFNYKHNSLSKNKNNKLFLIDNCYYVNLVDKYISYCITNDIPLCDINGNELNSEKAYYSFIKTVLSYYRLNSIEKAILNKINDFTKDFKFDRLKRYMESYTYNLPYQEEYFEFRKGIENYTKKICYTDTNEYEYNLENKKTKIKTKHKPSELVVYDIKERDPNKEDILYVVDIKDNHHNGAMRFVNDLYDNYDSNFGLLLEKYNVKFVCARDFNDFKTQVNEYLVKNPNCKFKEIHITGHNDVYSNNLIHKPNYGYLDIKGNPLKNENNLSNYSEYIKPKNIPKKPEYSWGEWVVISLIDDLVCNFNDLYKYNNLYSNLNNSNRNNHDIEIDKLIDQRIEIARLKVCNKQGNSNSILIPQSSKNLSSLEKLVLNENNKSDLINDYDEIDKKIETFIKSRANMKINDYLDSRIVIRFNYMKLKKDRFNYIKFKKEIEHKMRERTAFFKKISGGKPIVLIVQACKGGIKQKYQPAMIKFLTYLMPANSKAFAFGDSNKNDFYCVSSNGSIMPITTINNINSNVKCFKRKEMSNYRKDNPYNRFQNDIFNIIETSVEEINN